MPRFCHACGVKTYESAKFCEGCGIELIALQKEEIAVEKKQNDNSVPEKIRENLKQYSKHLNLTCLECGYVGLMGVSGIDESKKNKWGIWVLGGLGFVVGLSYGFVAAIVLGAIGGIFLALSDREKIKTHVVCPSCLKELKVN